MNVAAAFPADVATLSLTRRFVESALAGVSATIEQVDAAVLVTNELASNAMQHAGDADVVVRLTCNGAELRVEVSDHGGTLDATGPDDVLPWSGLGLVTSHAGRWGVEGGPGGKTVGAPMTPDETSEPNADTPAPSGTPNPVPLCDRVGNAGETASPPGADVNDDEEGSGERPTPAGRAVVDDCLP